MFGSWTALASLFTIVCDSTMFSFFLSEGRGVLRVGRLLSPSGVVHLSGVILLAFRAKTDKKQLLLHFEAILGSPQTIGRK